MGSKARGKIEKSNKSELEIVCHTEACLKISRLRAIFSESAKNIFKLKGQN